MFKHYTGKTSHRPRPTKEEKDRLKIKSEKTQIIESEMINESIIDELKTIHNSGFIKLIAVELTDYAVIQARYRFIDVVEGEKDYGRECIYPFGHLKED